VGRGDRPLGLERRDDLLVRGGVTDSFGAQLDGMRDGLGFLHGSACPHYDGEELRRPRYRELVDSGFPAGYAADDGVGLHFVGTELREVVTVREGATAYRVEPGSETSLEARLL
jgi:dipeptidase E